MNTSQICVPGHISGDRVMFDFSPFESAEAPSCSCTIYIVAGSRLEFNYVYSPGYYGCGSAITISHQTTSTIRCLQGAESLIVTPGDSVTVQISRERDVFDSKYCYLLRAYQMNGLDRVPGSMIVVCSQPPQSSTTNAATSTTAITTPNRQLNTTTTATTTSTSDAKSTQAYISTSELTSFPLTSIVNFTSTILVTEPTKEATTKNNGTVTVRPETEHSENRDLAHFPWEIITPLSIIIFILIVVAIIIFKVRRRQYLKSTYKPAETRTTSWAFNQPSLSVSTPKIPQSLKPRIEKTDSGVYSTLGENDKRSTESVHKAVEKYYKEVSIDEAIVKSEARKLRRQEEAKEEKDGLDNAGFIVDETIHGNSSQNMSSAESSQSDITTFISKICAADTENQNYFLDYKDRNEGTEDTSVKAMCDEELSSPCVVNEQTPSVTEKHEASASLPIDTGYVIIDVLANI